MAEDEDVNLTEYENIVSSGAFECLDGPQSIFWGWTSSREKEIVLPEEIESMLDSAEKEQLKEKFLKQKELEQDTIAETRRQKIIDTFNKYGLNAVSDVDPRAADLTTVVVSKTGLRTPFVRPEDAKQTAIMAAYVVKDLSGVKKFDTMSYASCLNIHKMADPLEKGATKESNRLTGTIGLIYPNKENANKIFSKYGMNFVERKLAEAKNSSHLLTDKEVKKYGLLFRGQQDARDDIVLFNIESKAVNLATTDLEYANKFPYIKKNDNESYAFIFGYKEYKGQRFYDDYGFEEGQKLIDKEQKFNDQNIKVKPETVIITPGLNKKEVELLRFRKNGEMRYFIIPENDPEWNDFKLLHTQADLTENENLVNRVLNAKQEALENGGHPKAVDWLGKFTPEVLQRMDEDLKKTEPNLNKTNQQEVDNQPWDMETQQDSGNNRLQGFSGNEKGGESSDVVTNDQAQERIVKPKKSSSPKDKVIALYRLSRGKVKKFVRQSIHKTNINPKNFFKGGRE